MIVNRVPLQALKLRQSMVRKTLSAQKQLDPKSQSISQFRTRRLLPIITSHTTVWHDGIPNSSDWKDIIADWTKVQRTSGTTQSVGTPHGACFTRHSIKHLLKGHCPVEEVEHIQAQTGFDVEGQDVFCRQQCFLAHDGESFFSKARKAIRQAKNQLEIHTAFGFVRSRNEARVYIQELSSYCT